MRCHHPFLLTLFALIVVPVVAAGAPGGGDALFGDGFEAGELCAVTWSAVVNREVCDGLDNDCDLAVDDGGPLCFTADPCLEAVCAGASGCVEVVATGAACDDGDACTAADACSSLGACVGDPLTCPAGSACSPFGGCACDVAGLDLCPDGCFNLATDAGHCGDCGAACDPGQLCSVGACIDPAPFEVDPAGAASTVIGPPGGELQVVSSGTTVRVVFPPGALLADTLVTATPVTSFPLPGFANGVHLEPEGLAFFTPVEVHVTGSSSFAFGYDEQAQDVHLRPATGAAGTITTTVIELWHFSGVGTGEGAAPATSPTSPEAQVLDALGRGDVAAAQPALAMQWTSVEAALATVGADRASFDAAAQVFITWRDLVALAGLDAEFATHLASGDTSLTQGLVAERDRIVAAAVASGDWHGLLDLESWLLPRADLFALAGDDSPVSAAAVRAVVPMTATLSDVALVYDAGDQRYHLVGQASTSFNGGPPITDPPVAIDASLLGTLVGIVEGSADGGTFDLPVTQNRQHLSGSVSGLFSGFALLEIFASTTVAADNEAPLSILVTAQPESFFVDAGSNITASVFRGAGPLGLAGTVDLSLDGSTAGCTLGSRGGVPDAPGAVHATLSCNGTRYFAVVANVTHRSETSFGAVFVQSTVDCSDAPPWQPGDTCTIPDGMLMDDACPCFGSSCPAGTAPCCYEHVCECAVCI